MKRSSLSCLFFTAISYVAMAHPSLEELGAILPQARKEIEDRIASFKKVPTQGNIIDHVCTIAGSAARPIFEKKNKPEILVCNNDISVKFSFAGEKVISLSGICDGVSDAIKACCFGNEQKDLNMMFKGENIEEIRKKAMVHSCVRSCVRVAFVEHLTSRGLLPKSVLNFLGLSQDSLPRMMFKKHNSEVNQEEDAILSLALEQEDIQEDDNEIGGWNSGIRLIHPEEIIHFQGQQMASRIVYEIQNAFAPIQFPGQTRRVVQNPINRPVRNSQNRAQGIPSIEEVCKNFFKKIKDSVVDQVEKDKLSKEKSDYLIESASTVAVDVALAWLKSEEGSGQSSKIKVQRALYGARERLIKYAHSFALVYVQEKGNKEQKELLDFLPSEEAVNLFGKNFFDKMLSPEKPIEDKETLENAALFVETYCPEEKDVYVTLATGRSPQELLFLYRPNCITLGVVDQILNPLKNEKSDRFLKELVKGVELFENVKEEGLQKAHQELDEVKKDLVDAERRYRVNGVWSDWLTLEGMRERVAKATVRLETIKGLSSNSSGPSLKSILKGRSVDAAKEDLIRNRKTLTENFIFFLNQSKNGAIEKEAEFFNVFERIKRIEKDIITEEGSRMFSEDTSSKFPKNADKSLFKDYFEKVTENVRLGHESNYRCLDGNFSLNWSNWRTSFAIFKLYTACENTWGKVKSEMMAKKLIKQKKK